MIKALADSLRLQTQDTIILAYGNKTKVVRTHRVIIVFPLYSTRFIFQQNVLGKIRLELINHYIAKGVLPAFSDRQHNLLWVVDFPLFTINEDSGALETAHHPFTAPHPDDEHLLHSPDTRDKCRSLAYDLVLNGEEIGGGSIRIHNADLQRKVLNDVLRLDSSHLAHLIDALESGCPPHGGIALGTYNLQLILLNYDSFPLLFSGIDRLMSIICKTNSIRDVIAFPKSFEGKDLLSKAPCAITDEELNLYHLDIRNTSSTETNDNLNE